jgi:hypothetical protein
VDSRPHKAVPQDLDVDGRLPPAARGQVDVHDALFVRLGAGHAPLDSVYFRQKVKVREGSEEEVSWRIRICGSTNRLGRGRCAS